LLFVVPVLFGLLFALLGLDVFPLFPFAVLEPLSALPLNDAFATPRARTPSVYVAIAEPERSPPRERFRLERLR